MCGCEGAVVQKGSGLGEDLATGLQHASYKPRLLAGTCKWGALQIPAPAFGLS